MADIPKPIELSKQVWMIPCKLSEDNQNYKPLLKPLIKQEAPLIKKTKWKHEEEELLGQLAEKSKRWSAIAKEININFHFSVNVRDGKQCRERWNNHLNPLLNKDKWTNEEDCIIIENFKMFGKKWAKIAAMLRNRTENQVKNRWKSLQNKSKEQNFYPYPIPNMNLNKLGNIEPIGNDGDNISPIGSFKIDDIKLPIMFDESKSPFTSMSSLFDKYFNNTQTEQYINSYNILDGFVNDKVV